MTSFGENKAEVLAPAHIDVEALFEFLRGERITVTSDAEFQIVVSDFPFDPGLADVAARNRTQERPWLLVTVAGEHAGIGPMFLPDRKPCWSCLLRRMWLNGRATAEQDCPVDPIPIFRMAVRETGQWLRRGVCRTQSARILADGRAHPVVAACPECLRRAPAVKLRSELLVSPYTALVSSIEVEQPIPGLFRARGELSQSLVPDRTGAFLPEPRIPVDGKGQTAEDAIRSCLGEAVERCSLLFQGGEQRVTATIRELGTAAVDPRAILLFSDRQYRRRDWWRRRHGNFHWPGEPFDESQPADWVEGRDASTGEACWLPAEHCLLGYGGTFAQADSNGCAAGSTRWRAALGALLELVERDAVAIWWYNRIRRPRLDWQSLPSDRLAGLAQALGRLGRRFWLLDVTSDLQISVYVAVSCGRDGRNVMLGSGAGADPETAAWRAMTEMTIHVLDLVSPSAAPANANERAFWNWWRRSQLRDLPHLSPLGTSAVPQLVETRPAKQEFDRCVRRLRAARLRVFLYDHTRQDLKIPVLRAVAPGLRHWWARFAPGRLYDVPVRMGWRPKPLRETELNPQPYFL